MLHSPFKDDLVQEEALTDIDEETKVDEIPECVLPTTTTTTTTTTSSRRRWPNCRNPSWIGDGECDSANKNPGCNYDGGDCCKREWISDGECDNLNKFASCSNYDGGDCARPSGK